MMITYDYLCTRHDLEFEYPHGIFEKLEHCFLCECLGLQDHEPKRLICAPKKLTMLDVASYQVMSINLVEGVIKRGGVLDCDRGTVAGYTDNENDAWYGCYRPTIIKDTLMTIWEGRNPKKAALEYVELVGVADAYKQAQVWFRAAKKRLYEASNQNKVST